MQRLALSMTPIAKAKGRHVQGRRKKRKTTR
jgi:hypothetical protein